MNKTLKPQGLICHVCGREYGTSSLSYHISTCYKKWQLAQDNLPADLRYPKGYLPPTPCIAPPVSGKDVKMMEAYNKEAHHIYAKQSLTQCKNCNKRFEPER